MTQNTNDTTTNGNTSSIRGRNWALTINNWTDTEKNELEQFIKNECESGIFQPEIGEEGTPHLQTYLNFKNARTFTSIKKAFPRAHIEKVRNIKAYENYCKKQETKAGETFEFSKKRKRPATKDPLENKELKPWQQEIIDMIEIEPDERTIHWYVDKKGNGGKSSLAKHLYLKYKGDIICVTGKASDIKYMIKQFLENEENILKIIIFDFSRSQETFVSYQAIEEVKNGLIFNTKYECGMIDFNPPHVIIFSNFEPEKEKLSLDRWNIHYINKEETDEFINIVD